MTKSAGLISLLVVCTACTFNAFEEKDDTQGWSVQKLYSEAKLAQKNGKYDRANRLLVKLEARYPYSQYAVYAVLEEAYNHYKKDEPDQALASIDRFIQEHPTHQHLDYAFYLSGLVHMAHAQKWIYRFGRQDLSERDPTAAQAARMNFQQLLARFPNSSYRADAAARRDAFTVLLAKHALHVARYYYKQGAYIATVNRAKEIIQHYPETKQVELALGLMVMAYQQLQLTELSDETKRILMAKYPNTTVLKNPVLSERTWWLPW